MKVIENPIRVMYDIMLRLYLINHDILCDKVALYKDTAVITISRTDENIRCLMEGGWHFYCSDSEIEDKTMDIEVEYRYITAYFDKDDAEGEGEFKIL